MNYTKHEAKEYARENMRGIWAAALNPCHTDRSFNEAGLRSKIRHRIDDLYIKGLSIAGKQGEFWAMSRQERKDNMSPDSGSLMEPETAARIADLPNIVAIKYSVPREMYVKLTHMIGDKIQVSTSLEDGWLDNIEDLDWQLYLCSSPPYQLQTTNDLPMHEYTELAFAGNFAEARRVRDSLDPVRRAIKSSKPAGKPTAHGKYWQELLGQTGGFVRHPMLELTETAKAATRAAFDTCGLTL